MSFPRGSLPIFYWSRGGLSNRMALLAAFVRGGADDTARGCWSLIPSSAKSTPVCWGILLSLSAGGARLCRGPSHLLPSTEKDPQKYSSLALAAGIAGRGGYRPQQRLIRARRFSGIPFRPVR